MTRGLIVNGGKMNVNKQLKKFNYLAIFLSLESGIKHEAPVAYD